ncbi:hypothetical protein SAMN05444920_112306 [Nonomuraea solani]|uniref:Uncharacterized protein n=1 Tax=Nonomuraea solani TaxID=1144553 RepID=A0A1H6EPD0_9ACTN|nr:hypothetical protein [Nonomuraea solani]SEG99233.1 hypothetical protein SAMN05444920_112306 [Nonomuraea solani]
MSSSIDIDKRSRANSTKRSQGLDQSIKVWNVDNFPNRDDAAAFVNVDPAQGAGEAAFSNCPDGSVDVYYYL